MLQKRNIRANHALGRFAIAFETKVYLILRVYFIVSNKNAGVSNKNAVCSVKITSPPKR